MQISPLTSPSPNIDGSDKLPPVSTPPEPQNDDASKFKRREGVKSIVSTLLILIAAPLIALFLTSFVFQSYEVDGPSMETTLQHRDRLIVLKTAHTWSRITKNPYIPKRGDIIVFTKHGAIEFGSKGEKQLIKRVIGLPGERVVVRDGIVVVYNSEHPDGFQPDKTMPYGNIIGTSPGEFDDVIPANELFVMGDNRDNSLDSPDFGPIKSEEIIGKLALRILPLSTIQRF